MPTREKTQSLYRSGVAQHSETVPPKFCIDLDMLSRLMRDEGFMAVCEFVNQIQTCKNSLEVYFTHSAIQEYHEDCDIRHGPEARRYSEKVFTAYSYETERIVYRDNRVLDKMMTQYEKCGRTIAESSAVHDIYELTLVNPYPLKYDGLNVSCWSGEEFQQFLGISVRQTLEQLYEQSNEEENETSPPDNGDDPLPPHPRHPNGGNPPSHPLSGGLGGGSMSPTEGLPQGGVPILPSNNPGSSSTSSNPKSSNSEVLHYSSGSHANRENILQVSDSNHSVIDTEGLNAPEYNAATKSSQLPDATLPLENGVPVANSIRWVPDAEIFLTQHSNSIVQEELFQLRLNEVDGQANQHHQAEVNQSLSSRNSTSSETSELSVTDQKPLFKVLPDDGSNDSNYSVSDAVSSDNPSPSSREESSPNLLFNGSEDIRISSDPSDPIEAATSHIGNTNNSRRDSEFSNLASFQHISGRDGNQIVAVQTNDGQIIIDSFDGVGKGNHPSQEIINAIDTIRFRGAELTAANMLLTQEGNDLVITFEGSAIAGVVLTNFSLENLDNLGQEDGRVALGNILFDGDKNIQDSFDVVNADWVADQVLKPNTVTFLNNLDNYVMGFDNANNVINGQGGNDTIITFSGDDIIRGGAGNDLLNGGGGTNNLWGGSGSDTFVLSPYGLSYVGDFTVGEDYIGLPSGLTMDKIKLEPGTGLNSSSTLIKLTSNDMILMSLKGVQPTALKTDTFQLISSDWQSQLRG